LLDCWCNPTSTCIWMTVALASCCLPFPWPDSSLTRPIPILRTLSCRPRQSRCVSPTSSLPQLSKILPTLRKPSTHAGTLTHAWDAHPRYFCLLNPGTIPIPMDAQKHADLKGLESRGDLMLLRLTAEVPPEGRKATHQSHWVANTPRPQTSQTTEQGQQITQDGWLASLRCSPHPETSMHRG
jgi:hypothetical protein